MKGQCDDEKFSGPFFEEKYAHGSNENKQCEQGCEGAERGPTANEAV